MLIKKTKKMYELKIFCLIMLCSCIIVFSCGTHFLKWISKNKHNHTDVISGANLSLFVASCSLGIIGLVSGVILLTKHFHRTLDDIQFAGYLSLLACGLILLGLAYLVQTYEPDNYFEEHY